MFKTLKQVQRTNRILFVALVVMICATAHLIISSDKEMTKSMQLNTYSYNSNY